MAEPSPARRPVPLIESGKTRGARALPRRPRLGPGPLPAAAVSRSPDWSPRFSAELYFLIARYLSAGPCRRAAQVSEGPRAVAALREPGPRRRPGSRGGGRRVDRGAAPAPLIARLFGCRCWCRSWSSIRSVLGGVLRVPRRPCLGAARPAPGSPAPAPPPPAPAPLLPCAVVSRVRLGSLQLLPKRLDWEGNEHNRSYEELVRLLTFPSRCFPAPAAAPPPRPLFGAPAGGTK